jgi:hypothetical protein
MTIEIIIGVTVALFVFFLLLTVPAALTGRNTFTGKKLDRDE